jgi:hypothetical protein
MIVSLWRVLSKPRMLDSWSQQPSWKQSRSTLDKEEQDERDRGTAGGPRDLGQLAEDSAALQADVDGARWLRRHMAAGAAIVSTVTNGGFRATTVNTCISTSLDPPQFLVSIERDSQMEDWLLQSAVFGISVLPWSEQFAADQFAGFTPLASSTFRGIDYFTSVTGAPSDPLPGLGRLQIGAERADWGPPLFCRRGCRAGTGPGRSRPAAGHLCESLSLVALGEVRLDGRRVG